jgi:hypothetical protein
MIAPETGSFDIRNTAPIQGQVACVKGAARRNAVALLLQLAACTFPAVVQAKPPSTESIRHVGELPPWRHVSLKIDKEVEIPRKKTLIYKLVDTDRWVIPAGDVDLAHAVVIGRDEYFLLRYSVRLPGRSFAEKNGTSVNPVVGGCTSERVSTLLVDSRTLRLFPHVLEVRMSSCSGKEKLAWRSDEVSLDLSAYARRRFESEEEYENALLRHSSSFRGESKPR